MKTRFFLTTAMLLGCVTFIHAQGLKDAIGKYCLIGAAVNQWQSDEQVLSVFK